MNDIKKLHINQLVSNYSLKKDEVELTKVYHHLLSEYQPKLDYWASTTSFLAGKHDSQALFDDTFMKVLGKILENGGDFVKLFNTSLHNGFKSLLRKLKPRREFEDYDYEKLSADPEAATFELVDEFNLEESVITDLTGKKKADQRKLIDSLLEGADADTTAIVNAFLTHPKPTATAIAKELGVHHSKVIRNLEKLGGTFDYKQFGDYRDYLHAL
jgi:DNA-directed RNA polymerase specialized sigma24 family protein